VESDLEDDQGDVLSPGARIPVRLGLTKIGVKPSTISGCLALARTV